MTQLVYELREWKASIKLWYQFKCSVGFLRSRLILMKMQGPQNEGVGGVG